MAVESLYQETIKYTKGLGLLITSMIIKKLAKYCNTDSDEGHEIPESEAMYYFWEMQQL